MEQTFVHRGVGGTEKCPCAEVIRQRVWLGALAFLVMTVEEPLDDGGVEFATLANSQVFKMKPSHKLRLKTMMVIEKEKKRVTAPEL